MIGETGEELLVRGVDGTTPLGFLAALGLLQVLNDSRTPEQDAPCLYWKLLDAWRPVLRGVTSLESVARLIFDDRTRWAGSSILGFRYVKQEKQGPKAVGGLKAPLGVVRAWTRSLRDEKDEASLAYGSALFCQDVTEPSDRSAGEEAHRALGIAMDNEVPTSATVERSFLDLTARNAQFLEQVEVIRDYITLERIVRALDTGEVDYDAPRTLDWDPASDTPGAIYTGFRRGYLPVHEWLGFRALSLFPLAGSGSRVRMTACTGRRLDGEFSWPLWERPASIHAIRALLGYPQLSQLDSDQRRAFGVAELLSAGLTKKADGYSGTFAPGRPV